MKIGIMFFVFSILVFQIVSATCNSGQIDINSATKSDLDKIIWVGPSTADKIADARPFDSIDDLTKVSGIGEVKLQDIKNEGLACVGADKKTDNFQENIPTKSEDSYETFIPLVSEDTSTDKLEPINLTTKDIKTESNSFSTKDYATLGLIAFSILLAFLFILNRSRFKNEFE